MCSQGNFGSVELCRYDPLGDNTGEMLAVKKLQAKNHSSLEDFTKEIHTLSVLHCDYVVQYRGVCYSTGKQANPSAPCVCCDNCLCHCCMCCVHKGFGQTTQKLCQVFYTSVHYTKCSREGDLYTNYIDNWLLTGEHNCFYYRECNMFFKRRVIT